jgi:hypothetical protein
VPPVAFLSFVVHFRRRIYGERDLRSALYHLLYHPFSLSRVWSRVYMKNVLHTVSQSSMDHTPQKAKSIAIVMLEEIMVTFYKGVV